MNKQQKIIVSIVGITIVLLALLGITYAYYLTRIQGNTNTNSISVTTADLKLEYGDGNGLLTATNIMPGKQVEFKTTGNETTTEKTFTVTNSGNSTIEGYAVSLDYAYIAEVMPSIFERPEDFLITLTCSTNKTEESCNGFTGNFNNESIMLTSNSIDEGEVHTYSLSIYYNDPGIDQSNDMGKNLNLKIQIYNINETTDIEGTITGVDSTHSVRIESEPKMSTIVNGKYNFKGVEIGTHTLTVLDKDGNEVDKEYIVVKSGTTPSITTTKATVNNTEVDATGITITKEERVAKLSTKVESNVLSFDTSTSSTTVFNPYSSNKNSLAYQIINNAIVAKNNNSTTETIYSPIPLTVPGQEPNAETERTLSITEDDYGNSYYYRGNVRDNYVNFAGMCWKIVRIEGDGSVKLILEDYYTTCNDTETTNTSAVYTGNWSNGSDVVFGFDSNGRADFLNYSGGFADSLKSFQTTDISNYLSRLKIDNWCYDNVMYNTEYYIAYNRLEVDKSPSLKCFGTKLNRFNDNTNMYVGALTADEVLYVGAYTETNQHSYNHYLLNSYTLSNDLYWWSLSVRFVSEEWPNGVQGIYDYMYVMYRDGSLSYLSDVFEHSSRPAVSLINGIKVSGGNGMQNNPYVIE